ncbi:hypothetical protein JS561_08530 [Salmonella enterica subsp. enterica serovar Infantis]|nr:hypothetical protein JS561_08530 [Salmonella enterica subsp. enterica serovar Infantis]
MPYPAYRRVGLISEAPSGKVYREELMSKLDLNALNELPKVDRVLALAETNAQLETLTAEERVAGRWKICPANTCFLQALASVRR